MVLGDTATAGEFGASTRFAAGAASDEAAVPGAASRASRVTAAASPGALTFRDPPAGLPDPGVAPPIVAETADPFAALRVIDLLASIERGRPIRLADVAAALNGRYLDWLFSPAVVAGVVLQLQANWMTDYRNGSGFVVEDGPYGVELTIEDSARVDPWIVQQAQRTAAECRARLLAFSRQDRPGSND